MVCDSWIFNDHDLGSDWDSCNFALVFSMSWFLAALAIVGKTLDLINPWSAYWVNKRTKLDHKKEAAQSKMDEAADKGDWDAYDRARSDKHASD